MSSDQVLDPASPHVKFSDLGIICTPVEKVCMHIQTGVYGCVYLSVSWAGGKGVNGRVCMFLFMGGWLMAPLSPHPYHHTTNNHHHHN